MGCHTDQIFFMGSFPPKITWSPIMELSIWRCDHVSLQARLFSPDYNFLRKRPYFNYLLNTGSSDIISTFIFVKTEPN